MPLEKEEIDVMLSTYPLCLVGFSSWGEDSWDHLSSGGSSTTKDGDEGGQ